jgi:hypothetical protein
MLRMRVPRRPSGLFPDAVMGVYVLNRRVLERVPAGRNGADRGTHEAALRIISVARGTPCRDILLPACSALSHAATLCWSVTALLSLIALPNTGRCEAYVAAYTGAAITRPATVFLHQPARRVNLVPAKRAIQWKIASVPATKS